MKLSTRLRYGLRLMLALAMNRDGKPVFLKDIAHSEEYWRNISEILSYL